MRALCLLAALALVACDENTGWNPNYRATTRETVYPTELTSPPSTYARYRVAREAGLTGKAPVSKTIPVALPAKAPTAADIAGPTVWQMIRAQAPADRARVEGRRTAPAAAEPSAAALARYAAGTSHAPGTRVWPRPSADPARALRACRGFATVDVAQAAFLAAGGPQSDPRGMDPDGDGYVCGWDPAPWRRAAGL